MEKNDLISYFYNTSRDFPFKKFTEDSLRHKELLFSDTPQEPFDRSILDMSQSFISDLNSKKEKNSIKSNWRMKPERNNAKENNITKNNHDDTMNFLTQGIPGNKTEVEAFVKGIKNVEMNSEKPADKQRDMEKFKGAFISMDDKEEKSHTIMDSSQVLIGDISAENIKDTKITEFFKNSEVNNTNIKDAVRNYPQENIAHNFPNMQNKVVLIPAFNPPIIPMPIPNIKYEPVKIDNIFLFNQKIKIFNDLPLWYLHYPMPQQTTAGIGPISSKRLFEMYSLNQVHGNTDFRPIDIFKFTFNNFNEFAKLKLINDDEWVNKIEDSPLLQYTELYSRSHKILTSEIVKNPIVEKIENIQIAEKKQHQDINKIQEKPDKKSKKQENEEIIQITQNPKTILFRNTNQNETLNLTQPIQKNEINNFVTDTIIEDTQVHEKTLFLNVDGGIKKEIEAEESGQWEVVKKAKKKQKAQDESVYLIGNKQKEKVKKENKFNCKIDLIPSEELVNQLKPKQKPKDVKPDYEAFNIIGNAYYPMKIQNQSQEHLQFFDPNKKKKKNKGKPKDIDVKLGFKI